MHLRNGGHGYGVVTQLLHWLTVLALATQFVIGYLMDADDGGQGRGRGRGRGDESGRGRGRGGEEGYDVLDDTMVTVHVALGVTILVLAVARVAWRRSGGLPPWAERLTGGERRLATWTERLLLVSLFAIPITGLGLVLSGDDGALVFHVAAHLVFFAALSAHVGLVLGRRLLPRMLPAR
jgi:cytochrome b561